MSSSGTEAKVTSSESKFRKRSLSFREKKKWRLGRTKSVHETPSNDEFSWVRKDMYACEDGALNDDGKDSCNYGT